MKIADGLEVLEVTASIMGKQSVIYPVLFHDAADIVLVDTGFPGMLKELREAVDNTGVSFSKLNKIIITHHDIDHMGCLSVILKELSGKVEVLAHEEEKPYIQGDKTAVKLAKMEARLDSMPEQMKPMYEAFKAFFGSSTVKVDRVLADGEELPFCGGITVIFTPGHTPGHISLYHKQSKTLITGDTLGVEDGQLIKTPPSINYDNELASASLKKLAKLDIEVAVCYHGGLFRGDVSRRIAELAAE